MRATEHALRDPARILELTRGLADIVERGGGIQTSSLPARGSFARVFPRVREPRGTRAKSRAFEPVQTRIPCGTRLALLIAAIAKMLSLLVSYRPLAPTRRSARGPVYLGVGSISDGLSLMLLARQEKE